LRRVPLLILHRLYQEIAYALSGSVRALLGPIEGVLGPLGAAPLGARCAVVAWATAPSVPSRGARYTRNRGGRGVSASAVPVGVHGVVQSRPVAGCQSDAR
jgi:hypothetical protein